MDVPEVLRTDDDDRRAYCDEIMATVAHWYGCVLTGRPNMLDHNASEKERHRLMKVLKADAEALYELVHGDGPTTLPVPPVVLSGQDDAA